MSRTPNAASKSTDAAIDAELDDLWALSAAELDRLYRDRALSPLEVTRVVLDRIEEANPSLGAFLTITHERALEDARAAEARLLRDERLGPLDGVPYSVKDVEPTAGIRTTYGSVFFSDHIPTSDSIVAERLRASGAILLGKTNTPHFGYKDTTDNFVGPTARNPWNLDRTTGGSSGGASAAVAAGLGPLAQGGDGGGSIRIPASLCGVFGFKPTFGLVPRIPSLDAWDALATVGPITRTVRDAAAMLTILAGPDSRDPWSSLPSADYLHACDHGVANLRIGLSPDLGHALVDDEVRAAVAESARRFEALGAHVTTVELDWPPIRPAFEIVYETGLGMRVDIASRDHPAHAIEPSLQALVDRSRHWSALDLREAAIVRTDFYRAVVESFTEFDLLLTPTMPLTAWSAEPDCMDGPCQTTVDNILDRLPFTYPFNFATLPAATLPCGFSRDGLPIGLQLIAARGHEPVILAAAAEYEQAHPWAHIWPRGFES